MAKAFGDLPVDAKSGDIAPFTAHIEDEKIQEFKTLLKLSKLPPPTYESVQEDRRYGVTGKWMAEAKDYWLNKFDWRKTEDHINSFPNFMASIKDDDGKDFKVHFTALFSKNPQAVPVIGIHGWPGSFLEFLPMMNLLKEKFTPETLPYHFINPSLTGYGYSSQPPLDKNWTIADSTRILNKLMLALGFQSYISTGGDVGSYVSRIMAGKYDECKATLINFCNVSPPERFSPKATPDEIADQDGLSDVERAGLKRRAEFFATGSAYAAMHGTRTSTIGHVLASNPLSLLAWIGEKFLAWTDTDPSLDEILDSVSLWWFNETQPTAIYPYRSSYEATSVGLRHESLYVDKPLGYLFFPKELCPVPRKWAEETGRLSFFKEHTSGGHFAAFEKPNEMLQDVTEFVEHVKGKGIAF